MERHFSARQVADLDLANEVEVRQAAAGEEVPPTDIETVPDDDASDDDAFRAWEE